jgi:hypothetical protein
MARKLRPLEPRNLALATDLEPEGAWRVEYFDSDGAFCANEKEVVAHCPIFHRVLAL